MLADSELAEHSHEEYRLARAMSKTPNALLMT
jgi:hypothetical protein